MHRRLADAIDLWRVDGPHYFDDAKKVEGRRRIVAEFGDVNEWNVCLVEDIGSFFSELDWPQFFHPTFKISKWYTRGVREMDGVFRSAVNFNEDISAWDVQDVVSVWHSQTWLRWSFLIVFVMWKEHHQHLLLHHPSRGLASSHGANKPSTG